MKMIGVMLAVLLLAPAVDANTIYEYMGPNFVFSSGATWTKADRITGSFTVAGDGLDLSPRGGFVCPCEVRSEILSYSFTDGRHILTEANSTAAHFIIGNPESNHGQPVMGQWLIFIQGPDSYLETDRIQGDWRDQIGMGLIPSNNDPTGTDFAIINSSGMVPPEWEGGGPGGVWTASPISTPEPATFVLLSVGLGGLVIRKWRGRR